MQLERRSGCNGGGGGGGGGPVLLLLQTASCILPRRCIRAIFCQTAERDVDITRYMLSATVLIPASAFICQKQASVGWKSVQLKIVTL